MPYCPVCNTEFREGVTRCPDCEVPLVNENEEDFDVEDGDAVEIYAVNDKSEAEYIKSLLDDNDIESTIRTIESSSFPAAGGDMSENRIIVSGELVDEAMDVIQGAIEDEVISDTGWFLVAEEEEDI